MKKQEKMSVDELELGDIDKPNKQDDVVNYINK